MLSSLGSLEKHTPSDRTFCPENDGVLVWKTRRVYYASTFVVFGSREFADDFDAKKRRHDELRCSTHRSHLLDRRRDPRRVDRGGADGGVLDGAQHQAVAGDNARGDCHILLKKKARKKRAELSSISKALGKRSTRNHSEVNILEQQRLQPGSLSTSALCGRFPKACARLSRRGLVLSRMKQTDNGIDFLCRFQYTSNSDVFVPTGDSRQRLSNALAPLRVHSKAHTYTPRLTGVVVLLG